MEKPSFNLWTEPWITVEREDGSPDILNLPDTLLQAPRLRALYDPSPLVVVGIHRLLTAILQDIFDPQYEEDLADIWQAGEFAEDAIQQFGAQYAHRFDLFSETEPFMQSADLPIQLRKQDKSKLKSVANLFQEIPAATAVAHYWHGNDSDYVLSPSNAAKGLLVIPAFSSSGGAGIKPSINGVPPIYILPGGNALFKQLTASLVTPHYQPQVRDTETDLVWWRREPIVEHKKELALVGYLHSLTFPARRVRLHPEYGPIQCSRSGESSSWGVRTMIFQMGESRPKEAAFWFDPFAAYRLPDEKAKNKKPPTPIRPVEGRVLWREYAGLFLQNQHETTRQPDVLKQISLLESEYRIADDDAVYPFRCIGIRTDMKAKIFEWIDIGFQVHPKIMRDTQAGQLVQEAIDFAVKCEQIIKQVFRSTFAGPSNNSERYSHTKTQMSADFWRLLSSIFDQYIAEMTDVGQRDETQTHWVDTVVNTGLQVFQQAATSVGTNAIALRQQIEGDAYCRARLYKARKEYRGE